MQQHAATCPPTSGTGPGAEATTAATPATDFRDGTSAYIGIDPDAGPDCAAVATVHVTHDTVTVTATITMGQRHSVSQRWQRRRGPGLGWALIEGPREFVDAEDRISTELGEYLDRLTFPFELANMLPRSRTAGAAAAIAEAAQEVARG
ncbi:hypothetical protein [Xanthomonas translucens]|uniref:hypothetical protein n=1 Tax=Xanthomonas campestris pv. translucens TaxID=343 RepID=UPI0021B79C9C|nr:hypothetical protein [Xanthomonas translucens]MCT8273379.1 hypothetical protein [Xanthomonas translucens pv. translucens]MCT8277477.1 hypothetical protein [Xanthomonas translucens pv. translucens]MCT8306330.1 hypothetical protein [Xanthomonas translucens pv. translucens]WNJ27835.1 hypothetical protein RMA73_04170 [Xanthomonas translucens pv. translucens]